MQEIILIKQESAGFAYSAYEKVIKLKIRPAREGWFFEERGGTKGGTLTEKPTINVGSEVAAIDLLNAKVNEAVAAGYKVVNPVLAATPRSASPQP